MSDERACAPHRGIAATLLLIWALWTPASVLSAQPATAPAPARTFADCATVPAGRNREIRIGACVRSTLGTDDPTIDGYIHYEDYRLRLRDDEAVQVDMDSLPAAAGSGTFDAYLEILRPGEEMSLRFNDDRTDSLNSTLVFRAPAAGVYVVRARALGGGTGDYALRVIPAPASQLREIRVGGEPIRSTLEENDTQSGERYFEEYQLPLTAGEVIQIDMDATVQRVEGNPFLDPYLTIFRPDSDTPLATNDDRGGSLDARLLFLVPDTGLYRVRAQGFRYSTGEYTIAATRLPELPRPNLLAGDRAEGPWYDGSPATERDGAPIRYNEYTFEGTQGERIQIDATSNLPPRLMFGPVDGAWIDDSGAPRPSRRPAAAGGAARGGVDSALRARLADVLPRTGTYIVRLEVPGSQNGEYRLWLTRFRGTATGDAVQFDRAQPLVSRLGLESGIVLRSGTSGPIASFYQFYALPVRAGERIVVTLESEDFDPVLDAGLMSTFGYAVALTNDDSNGWSSRLELNPSEADTIYLRARSFGSDVGEGRFTLRVVQGTEPTATSPR